MISQISRFGDTLNVSVFFRFWANHNIWDST